MQLRDMYDKTGGEGDAYELCLKTYLFETRRIDYPTVYLNIGEEVAFIDS